MQVAWFAMFRLHPGSGPGIPESFHPAFVGDALRFETNRAPAQTGFANQAAGLVGPADE